MKKTLSIQDILENELVFECDDSIDYHLNRGTLSLDFIRKTVFVSPEV